MKHEARTFVFWLRRVACAAFCVIYMSLVSCSGLSGVGTDSPNGQPTPSPTPDACAGSRCVGYDQNGQTLTLHSGDTLTVVLPATTWSIQGSSNSQVLAQVGSAVVSPAPFNKTTCPFGGCGTVTARFRAVSPGTAQVSASRNSCGEAMGCTSATGTYRLTVVVRATSP